MLKREEIVSEIIGRLSGITGIGLISRNPSSRPDISDMPIVNVFDFPAKAVSSRFSRNTAPLIEFELTLVLELFIAGTTEELATSELFDFYRNVLKAIFADGASLGGIGCAVTISEITRVLRPPIGGNAIGIGMVLLIKYVEDLNNL